MNASLSVSYRKTPSISPFVIILTVFVIVAGIVLTTHALTAHQTETWTATKVLDRLQDWNNGNKNLCQRVEIVSCPNAINHTMTSPAWGRPSPQFRVFCQQSPSYGLVGIFGMGEPHVYVTGYSLDVGHWEGMNARDNCHTVADWWLGKLLQ